MTASPELTFYEFFAGGGMARAGLGDGWECLFANDFDHKKGETYSRNWSGEAIKIADVRAVQTRDLPGRADLAWASFPCQDLSLAGSGAGLKGERSGTFWPFWDRIKELGREERAPSCIVLENVCGALSSHNGKDFESICAALANEEYRFGAVVIDAALFVPQSRPRLFIIATRSNLDIPSGLLGSGATFPWHTTALRTARKRLPAAMADKWLWWRLPSPPKRQSRLVDIIERIPTGVDWNSEAETKRLLAMMSDLNLRKVHQAMKSGELKVGAIYKRTRTDENGVKVQRAEVRFDEIAGCLRTPAGGSSRQVVLIVENGNVQSRLISTRETARLMGLEDGYVLPTNYNEAYHLTGDGVVVPVVRHIAKHILEPILKRTKSKTRPAA